MKRNLLLLLICLSLGGVTYFAYKNKKAKEVANIKRILKLDEHAVFKWEIHYDDVHLICEKKEPSAHGEPSAHLSDHLPRKWSDEKPSANNKSPHYIVTDMTDVNGKQYRVAYDIFLANVKNFNTLEYLGVVGKTDAADEKEQWGIDRNQFYKVFYVDRKGQRRFAALYRGRETVAPKGYYVASSESEQVYSVEWWVIKALEKRLEELRDKNFLKIEPEDISQVVIGERLNIRQVGRYWSVNGKKTAEVDTRRVDNLVQSIAFLRAEKVFATNRSFDDLKEKLTVTYNKPEKGISRRKEQVISFYLGKEGEEYYAKIIGQPETYQVPDSSASILTNQPSYYYSNVSSSAPKE